MATYFVTANLSHDGKEYKRGDTIDLVELAAPALIEMGIISKDNPQDEIAEPVAIVEDTKDAEVGGEPSTSGEPSIDETETGSSDADVKEITHVAPEATQEAPVVEEPKAPATSTKAAPVEVAEPENDPSANL